LKINLSGESDENKEESAESAAETVVQGDTDTVSDTYAESPEESPENKAGGANRTRSLVLLAVLAVVALAYFQKDRISGLLGGREETVQTPPVQPPPPPPEPAQPEPEPAPAEPDPVFVALNELSGALPAKVWLSSTTMMYDGSYELKGMAFSYDAMVAFVDSLGKAGKITLRNLPEKVKSSEAVYRFSVAGVLGGVSVPEILDTIPADNLAELAKTLHGKSEEYGVSFIRLPKTGQTYTERDLPFALEGSYEGLKKVVADLCPEGSETKVYRLVIVPASPGRAFDRIRASFSLRTVSAI